MKYARPLYDAVFSLYLAYHLHLPSAMLIAIGDIALASPNIASERVQLR